MNAPCNADDLEIARFDRLSRLWWDTDGKMRMLHVINPLRTGFIMERIGTPGARIMDVGCGGGILAEALARAGARVTGIDLSQPTLEAARRHAAAQGLAIDYRCSSAERVASESPGQFEAVTCMEMLEHVPRPAEVVAACARALRPGGWAFFSTINRTAKAFLFAIVAGEYLLGLLPRGTHRYRKLIRPEELRQWAHASGLQFASAASLKYDPLRRSFRIESGSEDVNYMACFHKRG